MNRHILFVHKLFPYSGAEMVTIGVANYLSQHGYRVTVMAAKHYPDRYPAGVECHFDVVEMPKCNLKFSPTAARFLRQYILQNQIDVLVSYREMLYMPWLKKQTGVKFIYVLHNMVGYEYIGKDSLFSGFDRWFYQSKYRRIFKVSDVYGVLCPQYRESIAQIVGPSADISKVKVFPNPIPPSQSIQYGKQKECIYVGRLTRRDKRVDRLLRIWAQAQPQMPGWRLTLVGSGKDADNLKQLAQELQLQSVSFEGYHEHVKPYYDRAAVLCMTSSFEGWPMSIGEAQSNGVVPIVFDSFAGCHDMISNPNEGIIVPSFDETAFAESLIALANNPARLQSMQQAVISKSAHYSIARTGDAWTTILNQL